MTKLIDKLAFAKLRLVLLTWGSLVAIHACYYLTFVLESIPAHAEWYARSHSYQLIVFSVVRLPLWIFLLCAYSVFRLYYKTKQSHKTKDKDSKNSLKPKPLRGSV